MSSIGLSIGEGHDGKLANVLKISTLIILLLTILQESLVVLSSAPVIHKICTFPCILNVSESVFEVVTVLWYRKRLTRLLNVLNHLYEEMTDAERKSYVEFVSMYRKLAIYFGVMAMYCVYVFNFLPIGLMLFQKFHNGVSVKLYPYFFWWPFDSFKYFVSTYIYEMYCGHLTVIVMVIALQLFILIVTQIIASFKFLGERIERNISDFESGKATNQEFRSNMRRVVDNHCELISLCKEVNSIFRFISMAHVVFGCVIICFTGFAVVVSEKILIFYLIIWVSLKINIY